MLDTRCSFPSFLDAACTRYDNKMLRNRTGKLEEEKEKRNRDEGS